MKTLHLTKIRIALISILFSFILSGPGLFAVESYKIAIVPFKINAEKDLTYLKSGIVDMLSSRLSMTGKVMVISREETAKALSEISGSLNEDKARKVGSQLGADHVLFGSLTVFGDSISVDAKVVDVLEKAPTLSFYQQTSGMGEVITKINLFAQEINEKAYGGKKQVPVEQVKKVKRAPRDEVANAHAHPESLLINDKSIKVESSSPIVMTPTSDSGFWKSRNFKDEINGLAIGDVDGDGKNETVFISPHKVFIYRNDNGHFAKIKEIEGKKYLRFLNVDVADIKPNGRAEIFVTTINPKTGKLDSFVLEWSGNDFDYIVNDENRYFRVLSYPGVKPFLVGQKKGITDLFLSGVYKMVWGATGYETTEKISLPRGMNIYSFSLGDITDLGRDKRVIAFNKKDYLGIYTDDGENEWKSDEKYGGSETHIEDRKNTENETGEGDIKENTYLSQRIIITDLDKDGKSEVVVVKNHSIASRVFQKFRQFSSTQFESLSWDGLGLSRNWHTRKTSGYTSDYAVGDFDNDGDIDLIGAVVSKRSYVIRKGRSSIIAYDLGITGKN